MRVSAFPSAPIFSTRQNSSKQNSFIHTQSGSLVLVTYDCPFDQISKEEHVVHKGETRNAYRILAGKNI
jgi:hypothetical protein